MYMKKKEGEEGSENDSEGASDREQDENESGDEQPAEESGGEKEVTVDESLFLEDEDVPEGN